MGRLRPGTTDVYLFLFCTLHHRAHMTLHFMALGWDICWLWPDFFFSLTGTRLSFSIMARFSLGLHFKARMDLISYPFSLFKLELACAHDGRFDEFVCLARYPSTKEHGVWDVGPPRPCNGIKCISEIPAPRLLRRRKPTVTRSDVKRDLLRL